MPVNDTTTGPTPSTVDTLPRYTFDNANEQGPRMLGLLADILDRHSTSVLAGPHVHVEPGWHCLDIGPGAGTITGWLADQVGPDGSVTAIDLQPDHVTAGGNVQVVRGDIRYIDLPHNKYQLIHGRLVTVHLPNPETVLHRLLPALAPGGVLVLSEWDVLSWQNWLAHASGPQVRTAFYAFQQALFHVLKGNGADLSWAGKVPTAMRAAGLELVHSEGFTPLAAGGTGVCLLHESNSLQLHHKLVATGLVTSEQLRVLREAMWDPQTLVYAYQMFTTVGRRPESAVPASSHEPGA